MDPVVEIKNRLSIEDVVADYVQMKKAGRNFKALCPFHQEKTPSFVISPEKQLAYCFSCHKGGDMFSFIQEIENIEFPEALKILAQKAGVSLQEQAPLQKNKKSRLFEMHELATKFFTSVLFAEEGREALQYLHERGLTDETIRKFELGFATEDWNKLSKHLEQKGYSQEEIVSAGLALWRDRKTDGIYDRFRKRIIFPLSNSQSQVLAFTGRILGEGEPKYLNSPESLIFHKKDFIYGFNFAKQAIKEQDFTLFTEGQMDTIMCHQAGFKNAVASSGTALTPEHLRVIKRFSRNLVLALDTDSAGISASERAIELALAEEFEVKVVNKLAGKDPAEIIQKDPSLFQDSLSKAISWFDFYFEVVFKDLNLDEVKDKQFISKEFSRILGKLKSMMALEHYLKLLAKKLKTSLEAIKSDFKQDSKGKREHQKEETLPSSERVKREECLLGLLVNYPKELAYAVGALDDSQCISTIWRDVFVSLRNYYLTNDPHFVINDFIATLKTDELKAKIQILALYIDETYQNFDETDIHKEIKTLLQHLKESHKRTILKQLNSELKEAEQEGNTAKIESLLAKQRDLLK
ncbi:MAG: DNA primase [Candidatus Gracilibacteria bacterium]|nr:DNA primase [Candidatus Gracilibacteria bacterium]